MAGHLNLKILMRFVFLISLSLFFTACSSTVLPDKKRDLTDFTPHDEVVEEKTSEDFNFVSENFPENCEWRTLERVVDGDTIIVDDYIRVRFIGVDTPELKHPTKPIQQYGLESSAFTKKFLEQEEEVCLIEDEIGDKIDIYGRTLAYIFRSDGGDLTAELLRSGLARGYFGFQFERKAEFQMLENIAREKKLNIWSK